jgi:HAD superfamily hydrolase (TIGR01549 family)
VKPLVLFDIDGTLHTASTYHSQCYADVGQKLFGIPMSQDYVKWFGNPQILCCKKVLEEHGLATEENIKSFDKGISDQYIANIEKDSLEILPGVCELLQSLKEKGISIGIITGNDLRVTKAKLGKVGLLDFFDVFGTADDGEERWMIVESVVKKAKEKYEFDSVFVVGDTRFDIEAAKKAGVKSIAVLTGDNSREVLEESEPDFILQNLSEKKKFLEIISIKL